MHRIIPIATLLTLGLAGGAHAEPAAARGLQQSLDGLTNGPAPRAAPAAGGLDLTADSDSSSVSLRAVSVASRPGDASAGTPDAFSSWSFTLTSPLDKSATATELANLSGFANSTTFEVKFSNVAVNGRRRPGARDIQAFCDAQTIPEGERCEQMRGYGDLFWSPDSYAFLYGVAAKVGYEQFDYKDSATLGDRSEEKAPWSASAYIALYPRNPQLLITLSYEHQEAWEAADIATVCPAGTPPVTCVTGNLGAPTRSRSDLVTLELRKRFGAFAAAPAVIYDAKHDIWGVEAPIYFVGNGDGGLTGGVKFGWRSDDDDLRVGVFISQPFSVLTF